MVTIKEDTASLTEQQWEIAHAIARAIARDLSSEKTDPNEVKKTLEYLRSFKSDNNAGQRFFQYLKTLANNGKKVGHSTKTVTYYRNIENTYKQYLEPYTDNPETILTILGWTVRLMRYYKVTPLETQPTINPPQISPDQFENEKAYQSQEFSEHQQLDATVVNIKKNKVTYELKCNTQRLTEKEPKKINELSIGQSVKVKITKLEEDKKIKHVKYVDS